MLFKEMIMKRQTIINSILIIIAFLFAFYSKQVMTKFIEISFQSLFLNILLSYLWWLIPTLLSVGYLFGFKNTFKEIGIQKGFLIGLLFSIITVLPMLISSSIIGQINENLNIGSLIHKTIIAGFMEEYLFRGFIFGIGHIYQGSTPLETTGVFFITAIGAIWFAWLFIEWNENLWIPIFLHILMNLSWILFEVSNNALGGFYSNLYRIITIAITIIITIYYHKKSGLIINKNNLIVNNNNS